MSLYVDEVKEEKKYTGNVVILFAGQYFAIRVPDSGLSIAEPYDKIIASLVLNPTQIDIRRVSTTISSFSFKLVDKNGAITALVLGDAQQLNGQEVRIFLGRSGTGMAFSEYFELPVTYITKIDYEKNAYNFSCSEQTERIGRPIYQNTSALAIDILAGTTTWTMRDDISIFPTSGFLKCDDEYVSYSGIDLANNRFTGVIRGELNSTPAEHTANTSVFHAEVIIDNPLNILIKILVSQGGGGPYDVLQSGLGIDQNLIDITGIETLRDDLFLTAQYRLTPFDVESALTYIENSILAPNNLRFTYSNESSKLTVAVLDKAEFVEDEDIINEDTITKYPKWSLDGNKVTNIIQIEWDYNEGTNQYQKKDIFRNEDSITTYGEKTPLAFQFMGPKVSLNGQELIDDFGTRLLARLSSPTPEISLSTQMDKSLQTIGDKAYVVSSKIPAADGTLNFESLLEVVSRSINHTSGDVQLKLAFTSFTNMRSAFIAPSDLITSFISQSKVNIMLGRAAQYKIGWYMRLWDEVNNVYTSDPPNKIIAFEDSGTGVLTEDGDTITTEDGEVISFETPTPSDTIVTEDGDTITTEDGDTITSEGAEPLPPTTEDTIIFENNWTTTLTAPNNYRIRFANYDEVVASQQRYGFISDDGNDFDDGKPTYRITY